MRTASLAIGIAKHVCESDTGKQTPGGAGTRTRYRYLNLNLIPVHGVAKWRRTIFGCSHPFQAKRTQPHLFGLFST
jgi:hypothetical protein